METILYIKEKIDPKWHKSPKERKSSINAYIIFAVFLYAGSLEITRIREWKTSLSKIHTFSKLVDPILLLCPEKQFVVLYFFPVIKNGDYWAKGGERWEASSRAKLR